MDRYSNPMRDAQYHIYDEVPREDMGFENAKEAPSLPPKSSPRTGSDKKNNNSDSSPVSLSLNREEEFMFLREKQQSGFMHRKSKEDNRGAATRSQMSKDDNSHRGVTRHESAPVRNNYPFVVIRRTNTHDNVSVEPHYQDPDDIRVNMLNKSNLKTQTSMPCIPQQATYEEADRVNQSLGFSCEGEDEGDYWSISRDTFCESGHYAEWPVIPSQHGISFPGKPFAQSTLKKQMSTSTTSSSRTDSSMVSADMKTYYEESLSSAAESPDLPKKFQSRSHPKSRKAFNHYTKIVMQEREIQVDPRDFKDGLENQYSQTCADVKNCCTCGDMVYISEEALRLRDILKFEQSQRLMAEQLFKLAEREVMDLQTELEEEKKITERLSTDLVKTKDKLHGVERVATEQRLRSQDLADKLNDANNRITQLEDQLRETTRQKQESQRMLDTKLFHLKSKNADSTTRIDMLQADLLQAQQEINRLLERLADVNREKSEMVSNEVHSELLRMADERAKRAELRAMAMEHELRQIKQQYNNSHNDVDNYPMVKVLPRLDKSDKPNNSLPDRYHGNQEYPPMVPPRGGFDYTQSTSTYVQGNRPRNKSSPASPHMFRKNNGHDSDFERSRPTNRTAGKTAKDKVRSHSKSPNRSARLTTKISRAQSQGVADLKNKTSLLSRVQSRMDGGARNSPKSNHKTFLDRVQSKFFASKKKDAVTPCDLPDINTLMQYSMKAEYETPLEYMKNYTGTPLIDNANSKVTKLVAESESDWSETDDELLEPGVKKAKRDKQKKGKKHRVKDSKDEPASQDAEARKDAETSDEKDSQNGSQKSKSSKPGPPVAPKPKKSSNTNTSSESLNSTGSQSKTNSTDAASQEKTGSTESLEVQPVDPSSPGHEPPVSFEELAPEKPQLKSYRRPQGPRGRRPPTRYSSHALSQTMSTTLSQIMA